ncbi:hypothetical protein [Oscillatoria sp. FACHB-1406]|uniref:hypothetical protein n=1 Tax=Oscillatoria sp. FACHB-1406 TaxID=2692846 RepID=UPI001685897F|nr:hypothetical protein [Oscillatoria sp. FACHB-1406]MBD2579677.1 hypothetical protein [Oscillatoria sp. FACHB-1406]
MIQTLFSNPFQNWFAQHPRVDWAISHPVISVVVLLVLLSLLVFLFQTLSRSIAQLNVAFWSTIFSLPLKLGRFLSNGLKFKGTQNPLPVAEKSSDLVLSDRSLELSEILQKLETINREQTQLLEQILETLNSQIPTK